MRAEKILEALIECWADQHNQKIKSIYIRRNDEESDCNNHSLDASA